MLGDGATDLQKQFIHWRPSASKTGERVICRCGIRTSTAARQYFGGFQSALLYPPNWLYLCLPLATRRQHRDRAARFSRRLVHVLLGPPPWPARRRLRSSLGCCSCSADRISRTSSPGTCRTFARWSGDRSSCSPSTAGFPAGRSPGCCSAAGRWRCKSSQVIRNTFSTRAVACAMYCRGKAVERPATRGGWRPGWR